ncbi:FAD-binding oxidoreductase [Bacillus tianshenii]|uniref:NAD(P)/FAD-dependent oxidoreductase n=1 Tax=Sutcliffiella tianshenii TaxID=1463404 RepID=UPI001CD32BD2|nr:FAD-binding oxidoreductase [Bacillus tianshenii]MCA1319435.1 FAD-binding oxidoreductase [Bacillus tianshenii]
MQKFVVIGGGVLGASAAYHLVKKGAVVTLIDRFDNGQATDAAAGIICPWISQRRNKAWYELVKNGARYYPTLIDMLRKDGETETGYRQVGAISLHRDMEKLEKMAERARKRREDAPEIGDVSILSPSEAKKLFPPLGEDYGAVLVSGGARVNGRAIRDALLNASRKQGATIINGNAEVTYSGNTVTGVKINEKQIIHADMVIDTGGAWSSRTMQPLGIQFAVVPQKAQIIHLELPKTDTGDWPVVMPPTNQYILAFENGRVVIGATHEDNVGFDTRVTAGGILEILGKALEVAPGLDNGAHIETRVGFRPFTPGFLPVIGALPPYKGILVANGMGASGLTSGPFMGSELARLALGEQTILDPSQYDVAGALLQESNNS